MVFDVSGEPVHTRCLAVALTQGEGDSVEFRADILDLRKAGLMGLGGRIATAGIIHKMEFLGSFAVETGIIERIEWNQSHVMHEANRATKGECCRDPVDRLTALVGTPLGAGFASSLKQCFGGPLGCTHVNTLFQELSAFVSRFQFMRDENPAYREERKVGDRLAKRSLCFDAFFPSEGDATSNLSVRLADVFYAPNHENGSEVLFRYEEVGVLAEVDLKGWQIGNVRARERSRSGPACEDSPWTIRSDELGDFEGRSLGGGMARFCLERFGTRRVDACLLSALLCLAPGMTQVGVAVSNSLIPSSSARPPNSRLSGPGPCYMLRADGPLIETIFAGGRLRSEPEPD
ncbi:MAG: DUF2889 domain-containing protein [bacterium]|nr:hypothetical protein [Deltaproteobacteria bacterium]MCP4905394.1 DUF2889 domain-containing protein [bacterium]